MRCEIIPESAVRFVRTLAAPLAKVWEFLTEAFPKRADLFPKNSALYGVDLNNLNG
jgi:hypothetical protein